MNPSVYYDTLVPFIEVDDKPIQYTTCRDYKHISRYKGLRQVIHYPDDPERYVALETPNPIETHVEFTYYDVPETETNRLDLIANKFLGTAQYSWVIAYFNEIEDGFTVFAGQRLKIVKNFTSLFQKGEILASVPALTLNLGTE